MDLRGASDDDYDFANDDESSYPEFVQNWDTRGANEPNMLAQFDDTDEEERERRTLLCWCLRMQMMWTCR